MNHGSMVCKNHIGASSALHVSVMWSYHNYFLKEFDNRIVVYLLPHFRLISCGFKFDFTHEKLPKELLLVARYIVEIASIVYVSRTAVYVNTYSNRPSALATRHMCRKATPFSRASFCFC